jgi:hypothetical protein
MKPSIKTLVKMFSTLNVEDRCIDFSDLDYYADQIETIFEVSEIEAYELAQQLKEKAHMSEFKMTGFYHVKEAGVIEFWQLLTEKGSTDLLWEMTPTTKINALMQSEDFDLDAHIKTNYQYEDYDTILTEIHDEMVDAITALEFCFATNQTSINFNGRSFENLDSIPEFDTWNPNIYYPIGSKRELSIIELSHYCAETCHERTVNVTVKITGINVTQEFDFIITGAEEYNCLEDIIHRMQHKHDYSEATIILN